MLPSSKEQVNTKKRGRKAANASRGPLPSGPNRRPALLRSPFIHEQTPRDILSVIHHLTLSSTTYMNCLRPQVDRRRQGPPMVTHPCLQQYRLLYATSLLPLSARKQGDLNDDCRASQPTYEKVKDTIISTSRVSNMKTLKPRR